MNDFNSKCKPTRPVLRYHGGKWRIAPWIISHFPNHDRYVEPFGGAGSVLLRKTPWNHEVYNDLDDELVNLFKVLREQGSELTEKLRLTPFSRTEFNSAFIRGGDSLERARKAVFRSMAAYGTAGFHRKTGFSVAAKSRTGGRSHEWNNFAAALPAIIDRLKPVIIENRPAIEVMKYHDSEETLHYVDPPYLMSTRDAGTDYKHELDDQEHEELAECLHSLKGRVLISGYASPLYHRLYRGWDSHEMKTRAQSLAPRLERLWIKPRS